MRIVASLRTDYNKNTVASKVKSDIEEEIKKVDPNAGVEIEVEFSKDEKEILLRTIIRSRKDYKKQIIDILFRSLKEISDSSDNNKSKTLSIRLTVINS